MTPHLQAASPQQARKLEGRPSHCPQGSRLKGALVAVEQTSTISWYLRMFSYLLMICGLFGLAVGGVVIYGVNLVFTLICFFTPSPITS